MQSKNTDILISDDANALTYLAAKKFLDITEGAISKKGICTVALSGGSTPQGLYSLLASTDNSFRERIRWNKIHFFLGDERQVPPDHADSNFRMVNELLISKVPLPQKNMHRVMTETGDAEKVAAHYEHLLQVFFQLKEDQFPVFDLILLGLGDDGHTASLFPGSKSIHEKKSLVAGEWVEKLSSYRITLTPPVLNNAACVMFVVSGVKKAEILKVIFSENHEPEQFPAQIVRPTNGMLLWLLDKAVSKKIEN